MRYIGRLLFVCLLHSIRPALCDLVETHRPYDKDQPILWTCHGCGRTESEYQ